MYKYQVNLDDCSNLHEVSVVIQHLRNASSTTYLPRSQHRVIHGTTRHKILRGVQKIATPFAQLLYQGWGFCHWQHALTALHSRSWSHSAWKLVAFVAVPCV